MTLPIYKRGILTKENPPFITVQLGSANPNDNTTAIRLNEDQIRPIVRTLSPTANQERRFIEYLARNPLAKTRECCQVIACVNLSHLRRVTADSLAVFGLEARCIHPDRPIKNGFGESTGQVLWALYDIGRQS
jgi:hypothetical protein